MSASYDLFVLTGDTFILPIEKSNHTIFTLYTVMKEYQVGSGTIMSYRFCDEERFDMEYMFLDMIYCFLHFIIHVVRPT